MRGAPSSQTHITCTQGLSFLELNGALLGIGLALVCATAATGQNFDATSLSAGVVMRETSRILTDPFSPSQENRSANTTFGWSLGGTVCVRRDLGGNVHGRVTLELTSATTSWTNTLGVPFEDGYDALLLDLGAGFALPFRSRRFSIDIGGGVGLALAQRRLSIAGINADQTDEKPGIGVLVWVEAEYRPWDMVGFSLGILARDPQVTVWSAFPISSFEWADTTVPLSTSPFASRINLNGVCYSAGARLRLP